MTKDAIPLILIPTATDVGLTTVALGLKKALLKQNLNATIFKPILQKQINKNHKTSSHSIHVDQAEILLAANKRHDLLEEIVANFAKVVAETDFVIIEGASVSPKQPYAQELNHEITQALDALVILVSSWQSASPHKIDLHLKIVNNSYEHRLNRKVLGCIINKVTVPDLPSADLPHYLSAKLSALKSGGLKLIAGIPDCPNAKKDAAKYFDLKPLQELGKIYFQKRITPPFFRNQLINLARVAKKKIVLPEATEPRTLKAAAICAERDIAECVLLGKPEEIQKVAQKNNILLESKIKILDPEKTHEDYLLHLLELRRHKGLSAHSAKELLKDTVVQGTMMLHLGEVDGLVSGAVHTTANTIRPALQIIKTKPETNLVSSIFFMCLPEQILVCGDCAINPNPTPEELAHIAMQSADSAAAFGIPARVAMLSYSTGKSGFGKDVDKVSKATELAKKKRPDLLIDGPLQYDAALSPNVARLKASQSQVAGKATVVIFPDLNTGNIAYKAMQRSANIISIGPMLQGLRKPVNDLSRGCFTEDIVFTIALTAVQASEDRGQW